ncbi:MAG: AMP-binding protein [Lysobacteraceae bacterium]
MAEIVALTGLLRHLGNASDRLLAFHAGETVSSHAFVRRVLAWQTAFAAASGTRFALHHEDSLEFAAALFGAWHAGKCVYLPADTLPSTLQAIAEHVDGFAGTFADALQPSSDQSDSAPLSPDATWDMLDPETVRLVLYTSGSSGEPAAIGKNLRQLDCEIATLESRFGAVVGDARIHGTVSHQHIYGLLFRVLWPLAAGRSFATQRLEYPEQIAALDASQPTALIASPAMLKRLPEAVDWSSTRAALRTVFSSGGPLPSEARDAVGALWNQAVVEVFGSTETGGIATRSSGAEAWRPLPNVECRLDDAVLHVRSRHLADDDWFQTADRARLTDDGFELLGRSDRLVKLEERRISLDAIERALRAGALIDDAHVVLLTGARDRIAAVVVLASEGGALLASSGRKAVIERLRNLLRPQVDAIAIPRLWRFVDALPTNAQGKTTQKQLADLFRANRPLPLWQEQDEASARLQVAVTSDMAVFDGHFCDIPILPGVAMIDWAIDWGRDAFAISQPFQRMEALKFQQLVRPDTQLQLQMDWRPETATLQFQFRSEHGAHASGRIVFAQAAAAA